jgi:hypothetical protein
LVLPPNFNPDPSVPRLSEVWAKADMTTLEWIAALVCLTLIAMLVEHRMGRRENGPAKPPNPVHYGHSDVSDHKYDNLPRPSSEVLESESDDHYEAPLS